MLDYARLWQATDKIVYSTTLNDVASARTRIERTFDPEAVRELKDVRFGNGLVYLRYGVKDVERPG